MFAFCVLLRLLVHTVLPETHRKHMPHTPTYRRNNFLQDRHAMMHAQHGYQKCVCVRTVDTPYNVFTQKEKKTGGGGILWGARATSVWCMRVCMLLFWEGSHRGYQHTFPVAHFWFSVVLA